MRARAAAMVVGAAILGVSLIAGAASARTWRVELNGSGDFTDVQPAVDAAAAGDTIRIGPGRFATFRPIGLPGYFDEAIVLVTKPNLTFIGAGKGVTRLGTTYNYVPYGRAPRVFFSLTPNTFALRELTVENVYRLVFTTAYVDIENCSFNALDPRIGCAVVFDAAVRVESCEFSLYGSIGIALNGPSSGATVRSCQFTSTGNSNPVNCSFGPRNVSISDCCIANGNIMFYDATGSISNCSIVYGIVNSIGAISVDRPTSYVTINDVVIDGPAGGLAALGSHVTAERLTIVNTTENAIRTSERSYVAIHDSNILPAAGWAVYCNVSPGWPAHTLDLTNNNWGVTDAAAIDDLIWDHNDDPSNPCTVLYEPYVGQPVAVESTSWGDLKALFR